MKALTVKQPWASLIIRGAKRWETRSWHTEHRGPLLLHVSKTFTKTLLKVALSSPFAVALGKQDEEGSWEPSLPTGVLLGIIDVRECRSTDVFQPDAKEMQFGDYCPGRWAWRLEVIEVFDKPIPCRGKLGLWTYTEPLPAHDSPST